MGKAGQNPFLDEGVWPKLNRRDDDIIIATYAKFGRLRMQVMIDQLLSLSGESNTYDRDLPWVELRHPRSKGRIDRLNQAPYRRILRTHLTAEDVYTNKGKYIYVGRDPRDLVWNLFHVLKQAPVIWQAHFAQYGFSQQQTAQSFVAFWNDWIENDGLPFWPYFNQVQSWWKHREKENVLCLHFLDFREDMAGSFAQIADFLDVQLPHDIEQSVTGAHSFNHISQSSLMNADISSPMWNGGISDPPISQISWDKHLGQRHETKLIAKLTASIGEEGAQWVRFGS